MSKEAFDTMEQVAEEIQKMAGERLAVRTDVKPPTWYKVIYLNDDFTTVEFVVHTLMTFFNHSHEAAMLLADQIHNDGQATVALLPYEIAEQKGLEVAKLAKSHGFPLRIKIEADG